MMYAKKLTDHEHAQAHVELFNDGSMNLISYTTLVCSVDKYGWLTCTGTYSATTIKHIGWFMREYCNSNYYVAKKCYTDNLAYNIYDNEFMSLETGEIVA